MRVPMQIASLTSNRTELKLSLSLFPTSQYKVFRTTHASYITLVYYRKSSSPPICVQMFARLFSARIFGARLFGARIFGARLFGASRRTRSARSCAPVTPVPDQDRRSTELHIL